MKLCLILLAASIAAVAADPAPKRVEVPAGAVETAPYVYRYTDAQGKTWIYRRTPFGVARLEDRAETAALPLDDGIRATEAGDVIRFERRTPFGVGKWEKKKAELDPAERAAWERSQKRQD